MQRIAVYEPTLGTEELDNLGEALAANELIRGRFADRFEAQIASYVGTRFGVGTNSGTAAIHTALMVAGVKAGDEVSLTKTEFRLLNEFADHVGSVLSRDYLLERVWGYEYLGDSRLVDAHVRRLRVKIEDQPDDPKIILTVRGLGYRLVA